MALGDTIVLVIMKKMSSRKMMSVMDAMLNAGLTFVRRLNIGYSPWLTMSMNVSDFASISFTTPSIFATR